MTNVRITGGELPAGNNNIGNMDVASWPVTTVLKSKTLAVTTVRPITDFGFSEAELLAADVAIISVITNNANVLWDGSTPTTTFGHPWQTSMLGAAIDGNAKINLIQVVSQTGTSNVTITLEQYP